MGKLLGSLASDEELDRPDLNKCPDCGCYFTQDACPLCGKVCPEEMRAGNRKKVKHKKSRGGGSTRVTFVPFYHEWWVIIIALIFSRILGLVLLFSSPHKRSSKLLVFVLTIIYTVAISWGGVFYLLTWFGRSNEPPVNDDIPKEEYLQTCQAVDPDDFYRDPDTYKDEYINMTLRIREIALSYADEYDVEGSIYYICSPANDEAGERIILVRNCILSGPKNFVKGDLVRFFGEGDGMATISDWSADAQGGEYAGSLLNCAYAEIIDEVDSGETKN